MRRSRQAEEAAQRDQEVATKSKRPKVVKDALWPGWDEFADFALVLLLIGVIEWVTIAVILAVFVQPPILVLVVLLVASWLPSYVLLILLMAFGQGLQTVTVNRPVEVWASRLFWTLYYTLPAVGAAIAGGVGWLISSLAGFR